jgi:hypothetical protein
MAEVTTVGAPIDRLRSRLLVDISSRVNPWPAMLATGIAACWMSANHYAPWLAFDGELLTAIVLLAAGAVVVIGVRRAWTFTPLAAGITILAIVPAVQFWAGIVMFAGDAWIYGLYLSGWALAIALGSMLDRWRINVVADVVLGAALAASILSVGIELYQWLRLALVGDLDGLGVWILPRLEGGRPYANLGQPNNLATLLVWGLVGALWFHVAGRLRGSIALFASGFLLFGIVLTQSRAAWVALVVLVSLILVLRKSLRLERDIWAIVALAVWAVTLVLGLDQLNKFLLLDDAPDLESRLSPGLRSMTWRVLIDAVGMQPLLGFGAGQVAAAQEAALMLHPASGERFSFAHNAVLDLIIWFGVPLGVIAAVGLVTWTLQRARKLTSPAKTLQWLALVTLGAHAMVELPHAYSYFLLPAGLMMGALEADRPSAARDIAVPRAVVATILAAVAGVLVAVAVEYQSLVDHVLLRRFEAARIGGTVAGDPPKLRVLTQLSAFAESSWINVREPVTERELDLMHRSNLRYPGAQGSFRLAMVLVLAGHVDRAQEVIDRLCWYQVSDGCEAVRRAWTKEAQERHPEMARVIVRAG